MNPRTFGLGAFAATCAWSAPAPAPHIARAGTVLEFSVASAHQNGVALTFDDGPDPRTYADPSSSFRAGAGDRHLLPSSASRWSAMAISQPRSSRQGTRSVCTAIDISRRFYERPRLDADLDRAEAVIAAATGRRPVLYRPPFGVFSTAALLSARRRGWTPFSGRAGERVESAEPSRKRFAPPRQYIAHGGHIVPVHDASYYGIGGIDDLGASASGDTRTARGTRSSLCRRH